MWFILLAQLDEMFKFTVENKPSLMNVLTTFARDYCRGYHHGFLHGIMKFIICYHTNACLKTIRV
jgi:hypothetical protein